MSQKPYKIILLTGAFVICLYLCSLLKDSDYFEKDSCKGAGTAYSIEMKTRVEPDTQLQDLKVVYNKKDKSCYGYYSFRVSHVNIFLNYYSGEEVERKLVPADEYKLIVDLRTKKIVNAWVSDEFSTWEAAGTRQTYCTNDVCLNKEQFDQKIKDLLKP